MELGSVSESVSPLVSCFCSYYVATGRESNSRDGSDNTNPQRSPLLTMANNQVPIRDTTPTQTVTEGTITATTHPHHHRLYSRPKRVDHKHPRLHNNQKMLGSIGTKILPEETMSMATSGSRLGSRRDWRGKLRRARELLHLLMILPMSERAAETRDMPHPRDHLPSRVCRFAG